jgi:hypothetical protein
MAVTKTGKGEKMVKATKQGNIKKNPYDTAGEKAHAKHGTMGKGPKKVPKFKKA